MLFALCSNRQLQQPTDAKVGKTAQLTRTLCEIDYYSYHFQQKRTYFCGILR